VQRQPSCMPKAHFTGWASTPNAVSYSALLDTQRTLTQQRSLNNTSLLSPQVRCSPSLAIAMRLNTTIVRSSLPMRHDGSLKPLLAGNARRVLDLNLGSSRKVIDCPTLACWASPASPPQHPSRRTGDVELIVQSLAAVGLR